MDDPQITDDEVVFRRIPAADPWFKPPDQITTANFKLSRVRNDLGVSVYRKKVVSEVDVLAKPEAAPGSFLAWATVRGIRALRNGKGEPLNLDVVVVDDENDAGHAEIRGPTPGELVSAASKALRDLFKSI